MSWINKIAWFFVCLLAVGLLIGLGRIIKVYARYWLGKWRLRSSLRRGYQEYLKIQGGEIKPAEETRFNPQPDNGMIVHHYKNGKFVEEETYTAREWQEYQKMYAEEARHHTRLPPRK